MFFVGGTGMNYEKLQSVWAEKYRTVPSQLEKIKHVPSVATAFNTNVDAILKIKGKTLEKLILDNNISLADLENITLSGFNRPSDVILGIVKCFCRGIAEEWVTDDINIYNWMEENLGYNRLQMGGQAGIIANALALLGVKKVLAHTNSHPKLQAQQFLNLDNLLGINDRGVPEKAVDISRETDIPLIHWIIEFDKNDSFQIGNKIFTCPKSNRFIATYDPLNMKLVMNKGFVNYLNTHKISYLLLSGFHPLLENNGGLELIKDAVPVLQKWKTYNPNLIIHLEIASTQDKIIRKAIVDNIVPLADSVGLNERETIDLLNILGQSDLAMDIEKNTHCSLLFDALLFLKKTLNVKRIQLHMFGLYMTLQDRDFIHSAAQNLNGMMTASVVSSSKAYNGELAKYEDVIKTLNMCVSPLGLDELNVLSEKLHKPELLNTGICEVENYILSAVPTIIVEKPKTLVGMGDTISSVSLLAGC